MTESRCLIWFKIKEEEADGKILLEKIFRGTNFETY